MALGKAPSTSRKRTAATLPLRHTALILCTMRCIASLAHIDKVLRHHGREELCHHVHERDRPIGLRDVVSGLSGLPQYDSVPDSSSVAVCVEHERGLVDTQQVLSYLLNGFF